MLIDIQRRVDSPYIYMSPACCQSLQNAFFGSGAAMPAMEVPSLY
jgi:hypothetical protein